MRRLLPLLLLAVCLLSACNSEQKPQAVQQPTVYVIDTARIFRDSEPGKASMTFLTSIQTEMQQSFAGLQTRLQADPENMEIQQEAQMLIGQLQQRMNAEEQNVMNLMHDMVLRVLDEYRTQNNISIIMGAEAVLSYDKSLDITEKIIAAVNKEKIEFKSVMPPAPPAAVTPAPSTPPAPPAEDKKDSEVTPKASDDAAPAKAPEKASTDEKNASSASTSAPAEDKKPVEDAASPADKQEQADSEKQPATSPSEGTEQKAAE